MSQPSEPTALLPCPPWCERKHIEGWAIHRAHIGEVEYTPGSRYEITVSQYGPERPPVLEVDDTDVDGTTITTLSVRAARQLYWLLGEALEGLGE